MHSEFIAEPIMNLEGKLLGVELLTRFVSESKRPLHPAFVISGWDFDQKRLFLYKQFGVIASKQDWFEHHGLFCSLNVDYDMATLLRHDGLLQLTVSSMPFIKLEVSEEFPGIEQGLKSPILKSLCQGVNHCGWMIWEPEMQMLPACLRVTSKWRRLTVISLMNKLINPHFLY